MAIVHSNYVLLRLIKMLSATYIYSYSKRVRETAFHYYFHYYLYLSIVYILSFMDSVVT